MKNTLDSLARQLEANEISATDLVSKAWQQFDHAGDSHLFTHMLREPSLQQARQVDKERRRGQARSRYSGIPITVKDLFDIEGVTTTAGSRILAGNAPATRTAPCIARLLDAGFIILGKVNMTEFAYSGLGLNPHFGTPVNPLSNTVDLIPGGSSSGSAVSVASHLVCASVGTDTGGSVRIPAAFCGLTGFKPGGSTIDSSGVIPLSRTLDSVGPLANSVRCCAVLYELMSGAHVSGSTRSGSGQSDSAMPLLAEPAPGSVKGLRLLVPENVVWQQAQEQVVQRTRQALSDFEAAGAEVHFRELALFDRLQESAVQAVIVGFESHQWHQQLLAAGASEYDPRVRVRLENGSRVAAADYEQALLDLQRIRAEFTTLMEGYDAVVWPTTACTAPAFDELEVDADYDRINSLVLRNTAIGNVIDAASISLPLPRMSTQAAAGLMLSCPAGQEWQLLSAAMVLEKFQQTAL